MSPIPFRWSGEAMEPLPSFAKRADEQFVVGATYTLAPQEDRSAASHRHYFAAIKEAWENLPEHLARQHPTPEHLRKWALIRAGYEDHRSIACASRAEALRVAAFVRPMDDFAVVDVSGAVVTVYTAKSQSSRAMGKLDFQASKDAVLGVLADLIGVEADDLTRAAA